MRAKANADPPHDAQAARSPSASRGRRRWADLIKRVWQVDPLRCPPCGSMMKKGAIDELSARINDLTHPLDDQIRRLRKISGLERRSLENILVEIGRHGPVPHARAPHLVGRDVPGQPGVSRQAPKRKTTNRFSVPARAAGRRARAAAMLRIPEPLDRRGR